MNSLKVNSPVTIKLHIYNTDSRYCVGVSMNVQCRWSQVCNKRGDNTAGRGCFVEKQEGYTRPTSRDETRQRSTPRENVKTRTSLSLLSVFIVHLPWYDVLQSDGSDVRPREPMELARGLFPFLADGKTRRGGVGGEGAEEEPITARERVLRDLDQWELEWVLLTPRGCWVANNNPAEFRPIALVRGVNLDADWSAESPSLITFCPLMLTLSYHTGRSCAAHKTQTRTVIARMWINEWFRGGLFLETRYIS